MRNFSIIKAIYISLCLSISAISIPAIAETAKPASCKPINDQLAEINSKISALNGKFKLKQEATKASRDAERQQKLAQREAQLAKLKESDPKKYEEIMAKQRAPKAKPSKDEQRAKMQKEQPEFYALITEREQLQNNRAKLIEERKACKTSNALKNTDKAAVKK